MGSCCCRISRLRHLPLLFLSSLLLCSTQTRFLAEGRPFPRPLQGAKGTSPLLPQTLTDFFSPTTLHHLVLTNSSVDASCVNLSSPASNSPAQKEPDEKVMVRVMIGSRPPRCERRCAHCGHCEAVQVPAVPQDGIAAAGRVISTGVNSRGDDNSSNYKPVSWKCKCGDTIMNP